MKGNVNVNLDARNELASILETAVNRELERVSRLLRLGSELEAALENEIEVRVAPNGEEGYSVNVYDSRPNGVGLWYEATNLEEVPGLIETGVREALSYR